jgi:putative transposase
MSKTRRKHAPAFKAKVALAAIRGVEALELAPAQGRPEICNTDQGLPPRRRGGSQFASAAFTGALPATDIRISMVGRGRFTDNILVRRLWRSVKSEEVYLHAYDSVAEARAGIDRYLRSYNDQRPHQALGYRTPREVFEAARAEACGFVNIAGAIPTTPQAPQPQPFDKSLSVKRDLVALS